VIGDVAGFAPELQTRIRAAEQSTQHNQAITLVVAANYGGQWDMVQAVKNWQIANPKTNVSQLTQKQLAQHLSTAGMSDVDLLIRTGGEQRISNFLLWQAAYAELYFTDVLWPDFDEAQLNKALHWYVTRDRRFGKVTE
jgi:undecaprenyl diphosphate synthase